MYLVHLDTKYVIAEGMYYFGRVAAFFKKSWTLKNRNVSGFLAKNIFAVIIVENTCYKDPSYVDLTKRELNFIFFFKE